MHPSTDHTQDLARILKDAISKPGTISAAFQAFHDYSVGNQMTAYWQCFTRGISPGPICTFKGWQAKGRCVKKGEKAIVLCMPITVAKKDASGNPAVDGARFSMFVWKARWFVLSQTEGEAYTPEVKIPGWDKARALEALAIKEVPFDNLDGNCQGYAVQKNLAINPLAKRIHDTLFHEVAHIVLGHTMEGKCEDGELTPRSLREVEAEAVSLILCEILGLEGAEEARGYIQHWFARYGGENEIPERSCQRIFKAANAILKAGQEKVAEVPEELVTA